ncbi:hypothetical protein CPAR01_02738 [Colletotrichum paranaense]|uniref:Uncharacterized protein n=1 Tax=Colletotrichum paranaense TaxID=1914294 RepID=A0ABQ9T0C8_9PEZI|nr:uncharacterized protein CPAR01_02738 [Colletotrichum paranaense]KAK1545236.1 hypothetical protein CPAR01_02738 [Colletotrichum paranaense]
MGVCLGPFLPQIPSVSVIQKCRYHPQPLLSFHIASCGSHLTLCTKWVHDLHRNLLAETSALHHRFVPVVIRPNGSFVGLTYPQDPSHGVTGFVFPRNKKDMTCE